MCNYSITFACYNSVEYTKKYIDSLKKTGTQLENVVAVDNGSSDETLAYLKSIPELGGVIANKSNYGCGVAWNQGVLLKQSEWSVIMNNDVIVSPNWIDSLIKVAQSEKLLMISPSLIEGPLDYEFDDIVKENTRKMERVLRHDTAHLVCLAVHESVWMDIGFFQAKPRLWGFEDTLFFHAAKKASIPMAITGASWLHHFGSITQSEMKRERKLNEDQGLSGRYHYKLLNESWAQRKMRQVKHKGLIYKYRNAELSDHGLTLHGVRENGQFKWL
jgi:N-acetylglucosaminyl-diphospho-decaprenol L-rhamnosyltransferase